MKNKNHIFIIPLLLAAIFSCSDWKRDATEIIRPKEEEAGPLENLMVTNFPEGISAMAIRPDGLFVAGTVNGEFYKTLDAGQTWQSTGKMKTRDTVNIFEMNKDPWYPNYVLAGTNKGLYSSSDYGVTWKEKFPARTDDGNWIKIYRIRIFFSMNYNMDGFDGKYNYFFSSMYSDNFDYKQTKKYISETEQLRAWCDVYFNNDTSVAEAYSDNGITVIAHEGSSSKFTGIVVNGMTYEPENARVFVATDKGVLQSTNVYCTSFIETPIKDEKVYSIKYNEATKSIFAATERGLYMSVDCGTTWDKIIFSETEMGVTYLYSYGNTIYFTASNRKMYYYILRKDLTGVLLKPVAIKPEGGSEVSGNEIMLKWLKYDKSYKLVYHVQIAESKNFEKNFIADSLGITESYYSFKNPQKKHTYYWRVRSVKLWGSSPWSDIATFTVK